MTNTQSNTLVLKDQAGEYYLLPQETLERGRIPEEHKVEVEHLIAEQQDVQGYIWNFILMRVLTTGAALIANGSLNHGNTPELEVPNIDLSGT
jgi:hypothetical protein